MEERRHRVLGAVATVGISLLVATVSQGYSFGPLPAGESIVEVQLSADLGPGGGLPYVWDTGANPMSIADDTLTFESSVTTIEFSGGTIIGGIPLGNVVVQSVLSIVPGPNSPVFNPGSGIFDPAIIGAQMANGIVADISITDIADGGNLLLLADYTSTVEWKIQEAFGGQINGSLVGDFLVTGGDAGFTTAFGPQGNFFSVLASVLTGTSGTGTPVNDICAQLTSFGCAPLPFEDILSHTTAPTTTITPIPEPTTGLLVLLGLVGMSARRRR